MIDDLHPIDLTDTDPAEIAARGDYEACRCVDADLSGRAIPVEVRLSPGFLERASTNPEDIRRRREAAEASRAKTEAAESAPSPGDDGMSEVFNRVF